MTPRRPALGRGVLLALAAILGVMAWVAWSEHTGPEDAAMRERAASGETPGHPPEAAAPPEASAAVTGPAADPTRLRPNRATLIIELDGTGAIASAPALNVSLSHDPQPPLQNFAPLSGPLSLELKPGRYAITLADDSWAVDEPVVTLEGGDSRTITVSSRRSAVVHVVGVFSGKPIAVDSVVLEARTADDDAPRILRQGVAVSPPASTFALLGVPSWFTTGGGTATEVRVSTTTRKGPSPASELRALAELEHGATFTLRMPEPLVVGRVSVAPLDDVEEDRPDFLIVDLLPSPADPPVWASWPSLSVSSRMSADGIGTSVSPDGSYELLGTSIPGGPVHLVSRDGLHEPADSGPLTLSARALPAHIDLQLAAAGRIHGRVITEPAAHMDLQRIRAHRLDVSDVNRYGRTLRSLGDGPQRFVIGELAAGQYEVEVLVQPDPKWPGAAAARRLVQTVDVSTGQSVDVSFDARTPSRGATVRGTVLRPAGVKLPRLNVELMPEAPGTSPPETVVDDDGGYAATDVAPGDYEIRVTTIGGDLVGVHGSVRLRIDGDTLVPPIDLAASELRLHAAATATLTVVSAAGDLHLWVRTDEDGTARIFGLLPGPYRLLFDAGRSQDFELPAGQALVLVEVP